MEAISSMFSANPRGMLLCLIADVRLLIRIVESPISAARARIDLHNNPATSLVTSTTPSRSQSKMSKTIIDISSDSDSDSGLDMKKPIPTGLVRQTESDDDDVIVIETQDDDVEVTNEITMKPVETEERSPTGMETDVGSFMDADTGADRQMKGLETQMSIIDLTRD